MAPVTIEAPPGERPVLPESSGQAASTEANFQAVPTEVNTLAGDEVPAPREGPDISAEDKTPTEAPATPETNVPTTPAEGKIPKTMATATAEDSPGEAPAPPDTEPRSKESEPEWLQNSEDLIPRPLVEQHQRSIANRALLHMCIHMYAQVEFPEYKLQEYEPPEHNLTEDGIAEPEEPEAEETEVPASEEAPDVPAKDKTPAEAEGAKGEVPAAATPAEYEAPVDVGFRAKIPGPAEDAEAPPGEVLAGSRPLSQLRTPLEETRSSCHNHYQSSRSCRGINRGQVASCQASYEGQVRRRGRASSSMLNFLRVTPGSRTVPMMSKFLLPLLRSRATSHLRKLSTSCPPAAYELSHHSNPVP